MGHYWQPRQKIKRPLVAKEQRFIVSTENIAKILKSKYFSWKVSIYVFISTPYDIIYSNTNHKKISSCDLPILRKGGCSMLLVTYFPPYPPFSTASSLCLWLVISQARIWKEGRSCACDFKLVVKRLVSCVLFHNRS